jgi:hypothetical protein
MNPFWAGLFENLRGRGRNATLFILVLPSLLMAAVFASQIPGEVYHNYILPGLLLVALIFLTWSVRSVLQARRRRRGRLPGGPLSDDELSKARVRLANNRLRRQNQLVPPV